MPVTKCSNGKWKIGSGKCMYTSKAKANKAYKAYLAKKQDGGFVSKMRDYARHAVNARPEKRQNKDSESTHLMAWGSSDGKYVAYPTLFQDENGEWYEPEDAFEEAKKFGEIYPFDSKEEAKDFADGFWKMYAQEIDSKPLDDAPKPFRPVKMQRGAYVGERTNPYATILSEEANKDANEIWRSNLYDRAMRVPLEAPNTTTVDNTGVVPNFDPTAALLPVEDMVRVEELEKEKEEYTKLINELDKELSPYENRKSPTKHRAILEEIAKKSLTDPSDYELMIATNILDSLAERYNVSNIDTLPADAIMYEGFTYPDFRAHYSLESGGKEFPWPLKGLSSFNITQNVHARNVEDVIAEYAHAAQLDELIEKHGMQEGVKKYVEWGDEGRKLEDADRYTTEGQLEHYAHSVVQPKLMDIYYSLFENAQDAGFYKEVLSEKEKELSKIKNKKQGGKVKQQLGYSDGSPFVNESSIRIQGNTIDMSNTGIPLLLQGDNGALSMAMPYSGLHTIEGANSITEIPLNAKTTNMKNKKSKKSSTKAKRPLVQDSLPTYQLGGLLGSLVGGLLGGGGAGSMQGFGGSPIASGGPLGGLLGAMGGSGGIMGGAGILGSVFGGGLGSLFGGGQAGTINPNYAGNVDPSQVTGFGSLVNQLGNQQPQPDPNLVSYLQTQGSTGPGSLFQQLQTQGSTGPGSLTGTGQQLPFGNLMDLAGQFRQGQQLSQRQSGNVDPLRDLDAYRVNPTRGFLAFQMGGDVESQLSMMPEVQKISEASTEFPEPSFFTLPQDALSYVQNAQKGGFAENPYLQVLDFESAAPMTPGKFEGTFNKIGEQLKKEDPDTYKRLKEVASNEASKRKEDKDAWMNNLLKAAVLTQNNPSMQSSNSAQGPFASYDADAVKEFENWKKQQLEMLNSQDFWMETIDKYGPKEAPKIKRQLIREVKNKQMPNVMSYQQGGFANLLFPGGVNVDTINQTPSNLPGGSGGNYNISLAQLLQPNMPFAPASRADYSFKKGGYVTRPFSEITDEEEVSTIVLDPSYESIIQEYDYNFKKGGSVSKDYVQVPIQFGEGGPVKLVSVEQAGLGKFFKKIGKGIKKVGSKLWDSFKATGDFALSNLGLPNVIKSEMDNSKFLTGVSGVLGSLTPIAADILLPGAGSALKGLQGLNIGGGSGGGGQQGGQLPSFGGFGQGIQPGGILGGMLGGGLGGMNPSSFGFGNMGGYGMPQNQGFNYSSVGRSPYSFNFQEGGFVEQSPLIPIQAEKGEKIIHPDLSITDVNAKKKHSQMDDDLVTDIVKEGSFIASADKDMRISREEAEEILLAIKTVPYKEIKKGKMPEEITLADLWTDSMPKKVTIAELVQRVKEKYPTVDWEDHMDIFDKATNEENVNSRMPWLEALSAIGEGMKEENPSMYDFKHGGKVKHIKKGVPMYQMGGDILGILGSALPMLGGLFGGGKNQNQFQTDPATRAMMMGSFPISTAGQLKQLRATQDASGRAMNNFGQLHQDLKGIGQDSLTAGLGTTLMSRLATNTDITAPTVRNSFMQTLNTQTPRSFIDAAGTPALDPTMLVQQLGTQGAAGAMANLNSQTVDARNQQAANQYNKDRQLDILKRQTLDQGINQQSLYDANAINQQRGLQNTANQDMLKGFGESYQGYLGNEASRLNQAFGTGTQLDMYNAGLQGQGAQIVGNQMFNAANAANTLDLQQQMANLQGQQYNQQQGIMDQLLGQLGGGLGGAFGGGNAFNTSMFPNILGGNGAFQGALSGILGGGGGNGIGLGQSPLYGGQGGGGILDGLNLSGAGLNLGNMGGGLGVGLGLGNFGG